MTRHGQAQRGKTGEHTRQGKQVAHARASSATRVARKREGRVSRTAAGRAARANSAAMPSVVRRKPAKVQSRAIRLAHRLRVVVSVLTPGTAAKQAAASASVSTHARRDGRRSAQTNTAPQQMNIV